MKRRDVLKSIAGLAVLPIEGRVQSMAQQKRGTTSNSIEARIVRLKLRHTWTTTMSSSDYRDNLHASLSREGITGLGEGDPIVRYAESAKATAPMTPAS